MKTYLPDLKASLILFVSYIGAAFLVNLVLQLALNGVQFLLVAGVINPETYSPEMFFGTGFMVMVAFLGMLGLVVAFWIVKRFINPQVSTRALNISTVMLVFLAIVVQELRGSYVEFSDTFISIVMPIAIFYFIVRKYLLVRSR